MSQKAAWFWSAWFLSIINVPYTCTPGAQDDDGAAYIAYSSEGNKVMHLARLAPSLDSVAPGFERALVGQSREAPVILKHAGVYFLFTSGCTGWAPNRAEVFYSRCGRCFRHITLHWACQSCDARSLHSGRGLVYPFHVGLPGWELQC